MKIFTRPRMPTRDKPAYGFYTGYTTIRKNSDRRYLLEAIFTERAEAKKFRDQLNETCYASIVPKKYIDKTLYAVYVRAAV